MLFSSLFKLTQTAKDDWFDPDLSIDTKLFVDPFLILQEESAAKSPWQQSHAKVIAHFDECYRLLAKGTGRESLSHQRAKSLLMFHEPAELCLGYAGSGTSGSGSGGVNANLMIGSIVTAIAAGISSPGHIEEVGILNKGIGADLISDATCNILKSELIDYTLKVVQCHSIPTQKVRVQNSSCDLATGQWISEEFELPINPNTGRAVLLIPKKFLRELPAINAYDWFDSPTNADLRMSMNSQVAGRVSKDTIARLARKNPLRIRDYALQLKAEGLVKGYDFGRDPLGIIKWHTAGETFATDNPITLPTPQTESELKDFIAEVLRLYKLFIEDQGGWRLIWNDDGSEKPEDAAQLALIAVARPYCRAHGVEIDREINFGRGPVDFKVSAGVGMRLLIEIKKLHNGKFWNGLEKQLPSYLKSDETTAGWYVAIRYRSTGISVSRPPDVRKRLDAINKSLGTSIVYLQVDGTAKRSASKI